MKLTNYNIVRIMGCRGLFRVKSIFLGPISRKPLVEAISLYNGHSVTISPKQIKATYHDV